MAVLSCLGFIYFGLTRELWFHICRHVLSNTVHQRINRTQLDKNCFDLHWILPPSAAALSDELWAQSPTCISSIHRKPSAGFRLKSDFILRLLKRSRNPIHGPRNPLRWPLTLIRFVGCMHPVVWDLCGKLVQVLRTSDWLDHSPKTYVTQQPWGLEWSGQLTYRINTMFTTMSGQNQLRWIRRKCMILGT